MRNTETATQPASDRRRHVMNGRLEDAIPAARRVVELASGPSPAHIFAATSLAIAGRRDDAIELLEMVGKNLFGTLNGSWAQSFKDALDGDTVRATAEMNALLEHEAGLVDLICYGLSAGYSLLGLNDESLKWIRKGMNRGFINYPFLAAYDPLLANVRSDPRFTKLMREVKTRWESLAQGLPEPLKLQIFTEVLESADGEGV